MKERCLDHAVRIARRLCRDAHWSGNHAGWMGWHVTEISGRTTEELAAIGPSMYNGSVGVALFLARTNEFVGDELIAETIEGTLRGLEEATERLYDHRQFGLYTGLGGVAWALAEIAPIVGDARLRARSDELLGHATELAEQNGEIDLLSGRAGLLVLLARGSASQQAAAARIASRLVTDSIPSHGGINWRTNPERTHEPLAGLSHGAAGIAVGLAEVGVRTTDTHLLDVVVAAIRSENASKDPDSGDWWDHRGETEKPGRMTAWCHGAPGIGLARIRLGDLLGDRLDVADDVATAIDATLATIPTEPTSTGSHSLCHGTFGNLEFLSEAAEWTGDRELAAFVEDSVVASLDAADAGFPFRSGARSGRMTPGLMTGAAGIGYALLRRVDPTIPSVLLP